MRSHYCGEITETLIGQTVQIAGWVHRSRDLGGVIFINVRDREGIVQVLCDPQKNADLFHMAETIRHEYVVQVTGTVRARPEGMQNLDMVTGKIEIEAEAITIINAAKPLPFSLDEYIPVNEETRLRYRYLDLRRPELFNRIWFRARLAQAMRRYLDDNAFIEIETPVLTKATPEGARDYLVPSRVHPGKFFALPQSPQLFKQLLMAAGMDRYYQIVRCFRDEDLRADRQPEFTQLDIEMCFVDEMGVQDLMEDLIRYTFKHLLNVELPTFPRLSYAEAMQRFGSDKPDLRIPMELVDVDAFMQTVDFRVFSEAANDSESRVAALRVPGGAELSRKQIDAYTEFVAIYGAKGLAYIKIKPEGPQSPILKFLPDDVVQNIIERTAAQTGDIIFFGSDKAAVVNSAMGALRVKLAEDLGLIENNWRPLWVVDFPMFEWADGRWYSTHHPFTAPKVDDISELENNPAACTARAYDMILNGNEIGGGSIRINNIDLQKTVFKLLGIDAAQAQSQFGFLLEAMEYGYPAHGGIAFGFDRIAMLMTQSESIREVIAFPKTNTAQCLLTDAPAPVSDAQLKELHIHVRK